MLYHYTTAAGLAGILSSRSLWATDTRYLNDSYELQLLDEEAREVLSSNPSSLPRWPEVAPAITTALLIMSSRGRGRTAYSVSFCTNPDLLSQWRGYGAGQQAFAIMFSTQGLRALASAHGGQLVRISYDPERRRALVESVLRHALETAPNPSDHNHTAVHIVQTLRAQFESEAPATKHESFAEEAEYRIVVPPLAGLPQKTRLGPRGITPHVSLEFPVDEASSIVQGVVVGPPRRERDLDAVEWMLNEYGVFVNRYVGGEAGRSVFQSDTPYLP
ncbi:MAG: hypothetical protein K0R60_8 [Microbacterium sp.]|nr:hypothetical protein [Microbacterium sp.]